MSEKKPKVSVCVVTYNQEKYIRQCLQSIVDQEVSFEYEIIVGEDCSSDGTRTIVRDFQAKYPKLFKPILHKSNVGVYENYRCIHFAARGKYIAHLDGDDYWLPGKLRYQVEFLEKNPKCMAVYANALVINEDGQHFGVFNNKQPETINLNYLLCYGNFLNHSSMLYKAQLKTNLLDMEAPFLDYKIHLCFALNGNLGYVNKILTVYRVNSSGSMIMTQNDKVRELYWSTIEEFSKKTNNRRIAVLAKANFMSGVFLRALKVQSYSFFMAWWLIVKKTYPENKVVFYFWIIYLIIRKSFVFILCNLFNIHGKVLFWR